MSAYIGSAENGDSPLRVLFLCTHNSARSQLAEALLRAMGGASVAAFSAGTEATRVHPYALALLASKEMPTETLASKHLAQFIGERFDYVITVCDNARDSCPTFPGAGAQLHWSFADPSAVRDAAARRALFEAIYEGMRGRIRELLRERGVEVSNTAFE